MPETAGGSSRGLSIFRRWLASSRTVPGFAGSMVETRQKSLRRSCCGSGLARQGIYLRTVMVGRRCGQLAARLAHHANSCGTGRASRPQRFARLGGNLCLVKQSRAVSSAAPQRSRPELMPGRPFSQAAGPVCRVHDHGSPDASVCSATTMSVLVRARPRPAESFSGAWR